MSRKTRLYSQKKYSCLSQSYSLVNSSWFVVPSMLKYKHIRGVKYFNSKIFYHVIEGFIFTFGHLNWSKTCQNKQTSYSVELGKFSHTPLIQTLTTVHYNIHTYFIIFSSFFKTKLMMHQQQKRSKNREIPAFSPSKFLLLVAFKVGAHILVWLLASDAKNTGCCLSFGENRHS